jgi:hypothetical protein
MLLRPQHSGHDAAHSGSLPPRGPHRGLQVVELMLLIDRKGPSVPTYEGCIVLDPDTGAKHSPVGPHATGQCHHWFCE